MTSDNTLFFYKLLSNALKKIKERLFGKFMFQKNIINLISKIAFIVHFLWLCITSHIRTKVLYKGAERKDQNMIIAE